MIENPWLIIVAAAALVLVFIVAVTLLPAVLIKQRHIALLKSRSKGRLVLTYDDGPGPLLHKRLLESLARRRAKASFFLVGFRAQRHPEACDELKATEHELGTHTHWHRNAWRRSPWHGAIDTARAYRTMSRWVRADAPFRPPFGKLTMWNWLAARLRGARICFWTCDGADTHERLPDPQTVVNQVLRDNGGVVLIHSHDRGRDREDYVIKLTEELLIAAERHGLQVCTMAELMSSPSSTRAPEVQSLGREA